MSEIERFNTFRQNVIRWSTERGIYEHSTALAQSLKAVSEAGELADAAIKGDIDALKDAIGDVAVCLVNAGEMADIWTDHPHKYRDEVEGVSISGSLQEAVASVAFSVSGVAVDIRTASANTEVLVALCALLDLCDTAGLSFADCCDTAWNEIKDRKGRMVSGGAFIKERTK